MNLITCHNLGLFIIKIVVYVFKFSVVIYEVLSGVLNTFFNNSVVIQKVFNENVNTKMFTDLFD